MTAPGTDPLAPLAHQIIAGGSYTQIVVDSPASPAAHALLDSVTPDQLLTVPITSYPHAAAMLAGLWLWHDALDECHRIAQKEPADLRGSSSRLGQLGSESTDVSRQSLRDAGVSLAFWHAIMHRREGDFSNSKYWYHRAAHHPLLPAIGANVAALINPLPADKALLRLMRDGWNPDAFVELAEELHRRAEAARVETFVAIQKIEWRMLFDHCARQAAGL
jgi:hypothetical protein